MLLVLTSRRIIFGRIHIDQTADFPIDNGIPRQWPSTVKPMAHFFLHHAIHKLLGYLLPYCYHEIVG